MKKKLLFYMILGLLTVSTNLFADEKDYWSYYAKTDWYDNNKENTVFTINNAKELAGLALLVNDAAKPQSFAGKTIRLGDHINLSDYLWVPIGSNNSPFKGSFDGQNKTISGMKIGEDVNGSYIYSGLFGYVYVPGEETLSFSRVRLSAANGAEIKRETTSSASIGGLIGYVVADQNTDAIRLKLIDCHNEVSFSVKEKKYIFRIGGLIGSCGVNTTLTGCSNSGNIGGDYQVANAGGLVGRTYSTLDLSDCSNSGDIKATAMNINAGGLVGYSAVNLTIKSCLNSGKIETETTFSSYVGGLVGHINKGCLLTDSYSVATISATVQTFAGGLVGTINSNGEDAKVSNCFAAGSIDGIWATSPGGIVGWIIGGTQEQPVSISGNVVMLSNMTGRIRHRIVNQAEDSYELSGNYAYVSNWPAGASNDERLNGDDWTGYMGDAPVAGWDQSKSWAVDPTNRLLPRLIALKERNIDVANMLLDGTVNYESNGGSKIADLKVILGFPMVEPSTPTRAGYRFLGWYASQEMDGDRWDFNDPITQSITLYAKWMKLWNVTFDAQGGSHVESQVIDDGTAAVKPADPVRAGYGFLGWFSSPDGEGTAWDFNRPITQSITLYARWMSSIEGSFTTVDQIPTQVYSGEPLTPAVTVRYGDKVLALDEDYTVRYEDNESVGTGCVVITGKGIYVGVRRAYFPIIAPTQVVSLTIEEVENATTIPAAGTSWYQAGLRPVITIIPGEGFSLQYIFVYLNEQQIYPDPLRSVEVTEEEGQLTLKLDQLMENARLRIEGISPVSIDATADDFGLSLQPNGIRIDAARASTLQIVRLNGAMEMLRALPTGSTFIGLAPGIYLVRIEGNSWKVIVK
ncbi:InlB B-repeat-containing protein [Parabacteroides sp. OttesenSCG-928-N08]|nr:InlB B-repeat-containing protein [Parabacteroides sp. OttesenSCG-928-N08]